MKKRPNVVFVLTDDQGYGDLGCTGNPIVKTPCIDNLYNESIHFTDYHVGPTCAPTRAGIFTGHYCNSTGVWHTIGGRSLLRKNEISLANVFKDNGYATGVFGKWHLGDNYPYRPHDRGFDEAIVHGGGCIGSTPDYWGNDYFDDTYFDRGRPTSFKGYCTDVFFRLGIDFIERHREKPFFCLIPTNAPHVPLQVDEKYVLPYSNESNGRDKFYGMIANIDENVGFLREKLEEMGIADDTIIVFMTDNGTATGCRTNEKWFVTEGYNANMRGKKCSPYDGGHRVPFFLHWKNGGYCNSTDVNALTANIDIMPTLIVLCGLEHKNINPDGKSLVPLIPTDAIIDRPIAADEYFDKRIIVTDSQRVPIPIKWKDSCVMQNKWRLIYGKELYNISQDPEQRQDVSAENPRLMQTLREAYDEWWEKVSKQFDEEIPISIGSDAEKIACINSHDWRGDDSTCAHHQGQIREGKICNSYVEIFVEQAGLYSFELRRWPKEENRPMRDGISGEPIGLYSGGKAIPIQRAKLLVGEFEGEQSVKDQCCICFLVELKKGSTHMQTFLTDENDNVLGAYYVYVSKVE